MKILECARCGAPLEAKLLRKTIKCNYCGATNVEENLATLHREKPKSFEQPETWRPRAGSGLEGRELRYKTDWKDFLPLVYVGAILLAAILGGTTEVWRDPYYGIVPADIATLKIVDSPANVAKELQGADASESVVTARFRKGSAGPFDTLSLGWGKTTAPKSISVTSKNGPIPPEVAGRLGKILHGGFDGKYWTFGPIVVTLRDDAKSVGIAIAPDKNPLFERQAVVALRVLDAAVFGAPLGVSDDEMRAVFGGGYPIADLARLDPKTLVADADARMTTLFPGASQKAHSYEFGLDHPMLAFAKVQWDDADEHGGRMRKIDFKLAVGAKGRRDAWVQCLAKSLGPAKSGTGGDAYWVYMTGRDDAHFTVRPESADMDAYNLFPADAYAAIFSAVDTCR